METFTVFLGVNIVVREFYYGKDHISKIILISYLKDILIHASMVRRTLDGICNLMKMEKTDTI